MASEILTCSDSTEEYKKLFERVYQVVCERLTDLPDKALQVCQASIEGLKRAFVMTTILHYAETSRHI
jgi:hypothetical protein